MHEGEWHDGWFMYGHMWGMWFWPLLILVLIALLFYMAGKRKR